MDRIKTTLRDELWIVLLDIISVNAAYFIAIVLRGMIDRVGFHYGDTFDVFTGVFLRFAPWYTVLCLLIFSAFHLYGGVWRYAGIRDMNRVIVASLVTCVVYILGSLIFVRPTVYRHMPMTVYGIGAVLQFIFIAATRFSYRIAVIEKRRSGKKQATALVVGAGDLGRQTTDALQGGIYYHVGCIVDTENESVGKFIDGIPVYEPHRFEEALKRFDAKCVFLAEPNLNNEARAKIKQICDRNQVEVRDYTSFFNFTSEMEANVANVAKTPEGRKSIPFSPPDISESEIAEVNEALRSGWITTGPRTKLLERRLAAYIETGKADIDTEKEPARWSNRVVCLNSATASEELNFRVFGVGPGDEIIVPAYTYTASASAAIHCGATVKFVDIQKDGDPVTHMPEMDYDQLEAAITERTKAVVVVDLGGIVADYERIFDIVEKKKSLFTPKESDGTVLGDLNSRIQHSIGRVAVFADCAHALGASRMFHGERKYCGALADFTDFSFHAVKNFTTAEGGASTWRPIEGVDNAEIYKMYQLLSLHGQSKDALAKTKVGAWEYDIIGPWYKCNMTDIMAAIGLRQLDRYPGLLQRRTEIIKKYDAVCDELGISHLYHHVDGMDSSNHLYLTRIPNITLEQRNDFITRMAEHGVATNVHYKPLPMMTAYKTLGWDIQDFPNTYDYYHNLVTLPLHTRLTDEDVQFVCDNLREVCKNSM